MVRIGITGGIGSGKSAVCEIWQSLGAYVINADNLAKELMVFNNEIREDITETFGAEAYHENGSLNRGYLADQAFEKGRVEELNAIVHPHIPAEVDRLMDDAETQGYDTVVYEAALLLQNLRPGSLDCIVLVLADRDRRIGRVQERDGSTEEEIIGRMNNQQDFSKLRDRADYVIENNGTLEDLRRASERTYKNIVSAYTQ